MPFRFQDESKESLLKPKIKPSPRNFLKKYESWKLLKVKLCRHVFVKVESFSKLKPCRHVLVLLSQSWKFIIASFALLFAFWEDLWEALSEVDISVKVESFWKRPSASERLTEKLTEMQSIYSLRLFHTLQFSDTSKRERATHWETHRNAFIHINTHRVSKAAACERAQRSTEILAYPHWSSSKTLKDSESSQR